MVGGVGHGRSGDWQELPHKGAVIYTLVISTFAAAIANAHKVVDLQVGMGQAISHQIVVFPNQHPGFFTAAKHHKVLGLFEKIQRLLIGRKILCHHLPRAVFFVVV